MATETEDEYLIWWVCIACQTPFQSGEIKKDQHMQCNCGEMCFSIPDLIIHKLGPHNIHPSVTRGPCNTCKSEDEAVAGCDGCCIRCKSHWKPKDK